MPLRPDFHTIQNYPVAGVTSLMRRPYGQIKDAEAVAEFKNALFAYHVANLLNEAAMAERNAELLIPRGPERLEAMKTRKYAPVPGEHIVTA